MSKKVTFVLPNASSNTLVNKVLEGSDLFYLRDVGGSNIFRRGQTVESGVCGYISDGTISTAIPVGSYQYVARIEDGDNFTVEIHDSYKDILNSYKNAEIVSAHNF